MFTRMKQGWALTKKSWSVVREHPGLAKLPLIGGMLAVLAALVFIAPGAFLAASDPDATRLAGYVLIAIGAYLASFLVIYYNVILAAAANDALEGREPDVDAARQIAKNRLPTIAGWALISSLVSLMFAILRDRGGIAGRLAATFGAAIWGLVTFLVVPVLALEGVGPVDAIKRSGSLVRQRWGQQVTGNLVIGGIATVFTFIGVGAMVGGVVLISGGTAWGVLGGVLVLLGLVVAVGASIFAGATRGVFGVALYHFVAEDRAVGPFTTYELASAATPRR